MNLNLIGYIVKFLYLSQTDLKLTYQIVPIICLYIDPNNSSNVYFFKILSAAIISKVRNLEISKEMKLKGNEHYQIPYLKNEL